MNGATLGVEEARHAAALFGGSITLVPIAIGSIGTNSVSAVIGGENPQRCAAAAAAARNAGVLFMNVACSDDAMRAGDCMPTTFHLVPSSAMYRDAVRLAGGGEAVAWDPTLAKFGADTLNDRFRARFQRGMTTNAWTSWFAVKVLWESSLRAKSVEPRALAAYLARETTQFDGHKGRPLSFRPWDHQLRQPVYVRAASGLVEEPAANDEAESSRESLDRIGVTKETSTCALPKF